MENQQQESKSNSMKSAKVPTFRRKSFETTQLNMLKWHFIQLTERFFYEEGGKLNLSSYEKDIMAKIFNWLIGKDIDVSLNKGLFLTGDFGTGKSVILKAIVKFINLYYSDKAIEGGIPSPTYILAQNLANLFKDNNEIEINRLKTTSVLAIDDIGYEPKDVVYFGTISHPLEEVLMDRYDRKRLVLLTSNMSLPQIGERYGEHIKDRIKQMVYVIEFKGKSYRK